MSKTNQILKTLCDKKHLIARYENQVLTLFLKGKALKPIYESSGYVKFFITDPESGYRTTVRLHRIIGYLTWGDLIFNPDIVIHHIDHNRTNNRPSNLCLVSRDYNSSKQIGNKLFQYKLVKRGTLIGVMKNLQDAEAAAKILGATISYEICTVV